MNSNDFDRLTTRLANTTSRRQALKLMAGGMLGGAAMATGLGRLTNATAQATGLPILDGIGGTALGTVSDLTAIFNRQTGAIDLAGVFTDTADPANVTEFVTSLLQDGTSGTCEVLHLELGPLDLNLLGLVVHLDRVVLDITAESGPGNLLGNLLCAVAGLLDKGGPLQGITGLLNNIFRSLGVAA